MKKIIDLQASSSVSGTGFCVLLLGPLLSGQSFAASSEYVIEATAHVEHLENPRRLEDEGESEMLSQLLLRAGLERSTERFSTSIDYQGRKLDYDKDLLTDRSFVTGRSAFRWTPRGDLFAWNLTNSRSFQVVDSLLPDNTDNRQVVKLTTTGPELNLQLTGADRLSSSYNYSWADYEDADLPGQRRQAAQVRLYHTFSSNLNAFVNVDGLKSEFDVGSFPGFSKETYSVGTDYSSGSYSVSLEAGETRSRMERQPERSGLMLNLNGEYRLNSLSVINAFYSRGVEDLFSNIQRQPVNSQNFIDDRQGNSNLTQIYEQVLYGVGYTYSRPESLRVSLEYENREREFQDVLLAQYDERVSLSVGIPMSPNLDFSVYSRFSDMEFPMQSRDQKRVEVGARATYRLGRSLSFQFSVMGTDQRGKRPVDNYDGLNVFLSLTYRHSG